ncbi:MAG TPA: PEP/pyruvate-binding domain-containing protein [Polyangium sp.]|nr:PEP/pyruvate-binding domain-containing protein [Polyangium sp.]
MNSLVLSLDHDDAILARVGGKGEALAKLVRHGFPVPPGFHVPTNVYEKFVETNDLTSKIITLLAEKSDDSPAAWEAFEKKIAGWFSKQNLPEDVAQAVRRAYAALGDHVAVAVRSSATAEDLPGMSFAGQQQSFLNIAGDEALLQAIKACWASLWTARAIQYRHRNGIDHTKVAMAVVVQKLVLAESAGILFTADPVSGARGQVQINAAFGLGEAIVGGEVSPDTSTVDKVKMIVTKQNIASKKIMTALAAGGTQSIDVADEKQNIPVLETNEVIELAKIGMNIEAVWKVPVDVEWARAQGKFFIVQARPITGLPAEPIELLSWNDSLGGDYLWTSANLGEAIPNVMTPCTWSIVQRFMMEAMFAQYIVGHPLYGNIGGRFYMNLSVMAAMAGAVGLRKKNAVAMEMVFGKVPDGVELPVPKLSLWRMIKEIVPQAFKAKGRLRAHQKELPEFLRSAGQKAEELENASREATDGATLVRLWKERIGAFFEKSCQMLQAASKQDSSALIEMRDDLRTRVGEADANTLLTGMQNGGAELASLGPLLGLMKVARGEMTREEYGRMYGHRCADEFEISRPRPSEDPNWIDKQLAGLAQAKMDPATLLAKKEADRQAAWQRLESRFPKEIAKLRRNVDRWAAVARGRESARSEMIRCFGVARAFLLRAGEISGQGANLFFLTMDEVLEVLSGKLEALKHVPQRRATYEAYSQLPPYPTLIRGAFEPLAWAKDPARRSDLFDATATAPAASEAITGVPGAMGIVEGIVRVLAAPEEGDALQTGEILVTTVTNIGWTPLFPRVAAVVTDVGAPLSHAAIVARELGIPAVVGCGNAMMRLHTGDRVRVDGARGVVELLTHAAQG